MLEDILISSEDIPGWAVAAEGGITVALDIAITDELQREGIARLAVVTDRQVAGLVPQADPASTTYGNGLGPRTTQPGVARIYRSAG